MKVQLLRSLLLLSALILALSASTAHAQFGEIAGQLYTNVSIGSSNSVTFTLVNSGSTPIRFEIVPPPVFKSSTSNTVPPTVTASPMNGTIGPNKEFTVNVMVYVPTAKNNTPGTQWVGILQAIVVSNSSSSITGSGANIQEGVAKIITITATAPKQISLLPYIAVVIVVVAAVGIGYLYKRRAKVPAKKRTAKRAVPVARSRRVAKAVRPRRRRARRRAAVSRRRRPSSKARAKARTRRRRRA